MTIDNVRVSLAKVFASGQAYVALSRARSMDGLEILGRVPETVRVDATVSRFYSAVEAGASYEDESWREWTACVLPERELAAAAEQRRKAALAEPRAAPETSSSAQSAHFRAAVRQLPELPQRELLEINLRAWRAERAVAEQRPACTIATVALIKAIARRAPSSLAELLALPGMDASKAEKYGQIILSLVKKSRAAAVES